MVWIYRAVLKTEWEENSNTVNIVINTILALRCLLLLLLSMKFSNKVEIVAVSFMG